MGQIIRPSQRSLLPVGLGQRPQIDWSHPLTMGMSDCLVWNNGGAPINLGVPVATTLISNPTSVMTEAGPAGYATGGKGYSIPDHGSLSGASSADFAVRVLYKPISWTAGGGYAALVDKGLSGTRDFAVFVDTSGNISQISFGNDASWGTAVTGMTTGRVWDFVVTRTSNIAKCYVNGALIKSASIITFSPSTPPFAFGVNASGGGGHADAQFITAQIWTRGLSADEVTTLYNDPYCFFAVPELPALLAGAPAAPSGTLVATEATDTAAINGTVAITGVLAATGTTDTASLVGTAGGATGVLTATETPDTASLIGTAGGATGILTATEATDTASLIGIVAVPTGTLTATEATDIAALIGTVVTVTSGTLVATEAPDTASLVGTAAGVPLGNLVAIETADTCVIQGVFVPAPITVSPSPYPSKRDYGWYNRHPPIRGKGRR